MTETAEQFLIDILSPLLSPVPVRRDVADPQIVRPIVIVTGRLDETYIPDARNSVAKIGLDVTLQTQVGQSTDAEHAALITQISEALPNYGLWIASQPYYESVYFGPLHGEQKTINDLVRAFAFTFYLVGRIKLTSAQV